VPAGKVGHLAASPSSIPCTRVSPSSSDFFLGQTSPVSYQLRETVHGDFAMPLSLTQPPRLVMDGVQEVGGSTPPGSTI
jgi:hypothetical protein